MPNNITAVTYINNIDLFTYGLCPNNITAVTYINNIDLSHLSHTYGLCQIILQIILLQLPIYQ